MKTIFYFMAAFIFLMFLFPVTLKHVVTTPQDTTFPELIKPYIAGQAIKSVVKGNETINAEEMITIAPHEESKP